MIKIKLEVEVKGLKIKNAKLMQEMNDMKNATNAANISPKSSKNAESTFIPASCQERTLNFSIFKFCFTFDFES